ncbi:MAG TPA: PepSY domain-containing protein [Paracoccus sp. (in: a-proteobacteria)]|uniref:PepSY domain-containing protein n=1 Tax=Paracoccus sp. TaxID=267 RepID=UPI002CE9098F|nr:PepSY domain-containing protein [Paracoccus sp. (in: a-proteobacteria)]HWL57808.1 PepSY domain-containing protein [Paracoccus sp. (in: a-proteobacteria)]
MKRTISTLALAAIAVASATTVGQARPPSDDTAEIQQFLKAPKSISDAIRAAESSTGGKAIEAEFDDHKGVAAYEVKTVAGDTVAKVKIDAASGQVIKTKDKGTLATKDDDDVVDPAKMTVSLLDVVAKAEAESGGKVMSVDHESENGTTHTQLEIVKADGSLLDYTFDASAAKLIPMIEGQGDSGELSEG